MSVFVPPFLVYLLGAPLLLLLRGRARQVCLVALAAVGAAVTFLLGEGTGWSVRFMEYDLVLLRVDRLSLLMGYIFSLITLLAALYAAAFARPRLHLYALLYAGTNIGAVFAGDFVTLLLFWELMAITSTLLVWELGADAVPAGLRYLLFHVFGGALLAGGIAAHFLEAGNLAVGPVSGGWSSVLIALGAGVNVGFIPLHTWLPDTYPRAHIASSVFLSVYTTKAAVYLFARAQPGVEAIALMGGVMALYGVSFALVQNNMRKLLSYHIVSQVGYMVAGVGLGTAAGVNGGMAHVFNHILYKALLFMAIGAVIHATGRETMDRLGGLGRKMPVTAATFWVAAFAISGVPGFNGYVSKGMVIDAAHDLLPLRILLEAAAFGTFLSFLKVGYFVFLRPGEVEGRDPPATMRVAQASTAALCVVIGLVPSFLFGLLPQGNTYDPWDPSHLLDAVLVLAAAAGTFLAVGRTWLLPHEPRVKDADVAYLATGRGTAAAATALLDTSRHVYQAFVATIARIGHASRRSQTGDLNWNLVGLAIALALIVSWLLWEMA